MRPSSTWRLDVASAPSGTDPSFRTGYDQNEQATPTSSQSGLRAGATAVVVRALRGEQPYVLQISAANRTASHAESLDLTKTIAAKALAHL